MAKKKTSKGKETITPPSKGELKQAGSQLKTAAKKKPAARTMADASVAKRQRVKRRGK